MTRIQYFYSAAAGISGLCALGLWQLHAHEQRAQASAPAAETKGASAPAEKPVLARTLAEAVADPRLKVSLTGNGRERLTIELTNQTTERFAIHLPAGETLASGDSIVVLLREATIELGAEPAKKTLRTAAVSTVASVEQRTYQLSNQAFPRLRPLLAHLADHPEIGAATAQTAVLALTENLPVCALAKFTAVGGDMGGVFDTDDFRVETAEIIGALTVLRELGLPDEEIALTIDPQLKIEAMIDSLAHAAAMRYYAIPADREWDFWKKELTEGDIRTRHYALFGIARNFPDVALAMLPDWVRQPRTNLVFRETALTALAETQRPAAVTVLTQLLSELGPETALGQTAQRCLTALQARLDQEADHSMAVAFRTKSSSLAKF